MNITEKESDELKSKFLKDTGDDEDCGFMVGKGKGKKFNAKMDMTAANDILNKLQDDCNDKEEDFLNKLKANDSKTNINSFTDVANKEQEVVDSRMGKGEDHGKKHGGHHDPESSIQDKIKQSGKD